MKFFTEREGRVKVVAPVKCGVAQVAAQPHPGRRQALLRPCLRTKFLVYQSTLAITHYSSLCGPNLRLLSVSANSDAPRPVYNSSDGHSDIFINWRNIRTKISQLFTGLYSCETKNVNLNVLHPTKHFTFTLHLPQKASPLDKGAWARLTKMAESLQ